MKRNEMFMWIIYYELIINDKYISLKRGIRNTTEIV